MELSTNSSGYKVRAIQRFLASRGHLEEGEVDGEYGTETREAVRKFQFKNALRADGIAGPSTLRIMGSQGLQLAPWTVSDLNVSFITRLENSVERVLEKVESVDEERYFDYSNKDYDHEEKLTLLYSTKSREREVDHSFRPYVVAEISMMHVEIFRAEVIDYSNLHVVFKSCLGFDGTENILSEIQEEVDKEFGFSD